jgi:hypothetical protein
MAEKDPLTSGIEHDEPTGKETEPTRELADVKHNLEKTLFHLTPKALTMYVRKRYDRLERPQRLRLAEIKVNFLRYLGHAFVQIHPTDANRVFMPPGSTAKKAPTINKILRTVHRYVAQITADEPVMEGQPTSHRDEARDAAEASTLALRGEFERMNMTSTLQRVVHFAAVMRSGFLMLKWDPLAGGRTKAQKFFTADNGERVLLYVDKDGKEVKDPKDAATITQGNMCVEVLTPANVRWEGARYAHDADEVFVAEVLSLRQFYEAYPKAKEVKVDQIIGRYERPINGVEWLQDLRGETPRGSSRDNADTELTVTGTQLEESDNLLDEPVLLIRYFRKKDRTYRKGFQAVVCGDYMVERAPLRYGQIPVVQFKMLDEIGDALGKALVDLLREPQELLDFVNGQILRYLQMMKRRWFVPMHSQVKTRDLMSPTRSIIEFNPQAGQPIPEVQPEIPNSMVKFVDRFDQEFDDQSGIHDTLQGKHVPGVSSGRHAEALRSGDETLLGLTRTQVKLSLEKTAEIMLAIMQREWKVERRVRYLGDEREYIDQAFKNTDFGDTSKVVLKNSTFLMLTPAQRLDTIMTMAESGTIGADEVRQLAPLGDVMGISLSEDVHYQRARRQNSRFLQGPPEKLEEAYKEYQRALQALDIQEDQVNRLAGVGGDEQTVAVAFQAVQDGKAQAELLWTEAKDKYAFDHRSWEDRKDIARIHAQVHADALAKAKVDRFEEWWVEIFEDHAHLEYELGFPELVVEAAQAAAMAAPPPEPEAPIDAGPVETSPAGMEFGPGTPDIVTGGETGAP